MSNLAISAEVRTETGKEKAKKLRKDGRFPAIVYGMDNEPVSLTLDTRETELLLQHTHGEKVLVDLTYGGKTDKVFVRNIQREPVKSKLLHVDFYRVDMDKEMETRVPVIHIGTPKGVKEGGLLETVIRQISIRCKPGDVPPHLEADVTELEIGHAFHVSDLPAIPNVQFLTDKDSVIFAVVGHADEPETGAAGEAAEGAAEQPAAT